MFSKTRTNQSMKSCLHKQRDGYRESIQKGAARPVDERLARTGTEVET